MAYVPLNVWIDLAFEKFRRELKEAMIADEADERVMLFDRESAKADRDAKTGG